VNDMFKLEIETGGGAFCDPDTGSEDEFWEGIEINRLLAKVQLSIEEGCTSGTIIDINGNKVGKWSR
jgi:hypothetical protein